MNAKEMLKRNGAKGRKFHYQHRGEIEIIKDVSVKTIDGKTKLVHRKGQIKSPHITIAEQLILEGIAKPTANFKDKFVRNERFGKPEKRS